MNSSDRVKVALAALPKATPGPWKGLVAQNAADYVLALAAPDLAAEVIRLRAAETTLLARVRERIEAEKVGANKDDCEGDRYWDTAISRALRAVDEVEKEERT